MALDNLTLGIITAELQKQLVGSSFGKPLALSAFDYGYPFSCRESDGSIRHGTFVFSLDPSNPFVTYSHDRYEKVDDSTPFFNSLKKLSLSTVTKVTKLSGERIITVSLASNPNDLSEINTGYDLILELFPNHPNCYLIAYPYGKIVSLFRERTNIENRRKGLVFQRI
jgi:predicted ribosome quality control (RQC) complex YloA/Tae2 family protein